MPTRTRITEDQLTRIVRMVAEETERTNNEQAADSLDESALIDPEYSEAGEVSE